MTIIRSTEGEMEAALQAANLMLISARTAPKAGGIDDILTALVTGEHVEQLASEMNRLAEERNIDGFNRDADNARNSSVILLVGARATHPYILNCGACGYPNCKEFNKAEKKMGLDFRGPVCLLKTLDLGVALGSAVKTASILNLDTRLMYRIGVAAMRLGWLPEADVIIGIPMSATGKNIYFDRKWPK